MRKKQRNYEPGIKENIPVSLRGCFLFFKPLNLKLNYYELEIMNDVSDHEQPPGTKLAHQAPGAGICQLKIN
jgi:hypothetical protein